MRGLAVAGSRGCTAPTVSANRETAHVSANTCADSAEDDPLHIAAYAEADATDSQSSQIISNSEPDSSDGNALQIAAGSQSYSAKCETLHVIAYSHSDSADRYSSNGVLSADADDAGSDAIDATSAGCRKSERNSAYVSPAVAIGHPDCRVDAGNLAHLAIPIIETKAGDSPRVADTDADVIDGEVYGAIALSSERKCGKDGHTCQADLERIHELAGSGIGLLL